MLRFMLAGVGLLLLSAPAALRADEASAAKVNKLLAAGRTNDAEVELTLHVRMKPQDREAAFGLAFVHVLQAAEHLSQSMYRHGALQRNFLIVPGVRLPAGSNPDPQPISYEQFRGLFSTLLKDLTRAEAVLAKVTEGNVKLPIKFGQIRLDLDGDGKPEEPFWQIYRAFAPGIELSEENAESFTVGFDTGDAYWLQGYCRLLCAWCEFVLAHDSRELFERCGHVMFPKVVSPHPYVHASPSPQRFEFEIIDFISFVHLLRFPVAEPERMKHSLEHLETVIQLNRKMWTSILAETDNDNEWIPNPRQDSVLGPRLVTREIVDAWLRALDEVEAVLQGKKLIPYWRNLPDGAPVRGVNLRRFFTEPREFDLVMWIQGSAATPYLETGILTTPQFWGNTTGTFRGWFPGFALWFN